MQLKTWAGNTKGLISAKRLEPVLELPAPYRICVHQFQENCFQEMGIWHTKDRQCLYHSVLSLKVREYEVLLYLSCASKNTFWYIFGFYSFYNIACYVWCSTLNRPTSYNTPRSSKTNLDLQERFSCATRAQGDERLNEQEQVGRRPKRGGAAFASVDIWALWGLELGAWPQTFSFWWGPDHIFIRRSVR